MLSNKRVFITLSYLLFLTHHALGQAVAYNFDVSSYDVAYEMDADKKIFKSVQDISIKNVSSNALEQINFLWQDLGEAVICAQKPLWQ